MQLYERVDDLRKQRGMTLNALSVRAGIAHSTLNSWKMRGTMPKLEVLEGICDALGITLATLLYDVDVDRLTGDETEMILLWRALDGDQKEAAKTMVKAMLKKELAFLSC